jgi:O-antigen/teichoic acid export membrane protein
MLKPALLIIAGRIAGFIAAFVTPLILVRIFDLETFGTYKQWFLLYFTLLIITQIGMSESLLYFLPRAGGEAGRYVMNLWEWRRPVSWSGTPPPSPHG